MCHILILVIMNTYTVSKVGLLGPEVEGQERQQAETNQGSKSYKDLDSLAILFMTLHTSAHQVFRL